MTIKKKKKKKKANKKLFILAVKNNKGQVTDLIPSYDYSNLMVEGMDLAKEKKGSWSVYRLHKPGVEIDGGMLTIKGKEVKK